MNKRGTGALFIVTAAFLLSAKYISAAIFASNTASWNEELFDAMLSYVGTPLNTCSMLALLVGVAYIVWGEYEEFLLKRKETI